MPRKAKRRAPGEGTIYYRESDERWVAELTLEDGKRKYLYAKKQEEVVLKLKQAQYELKQGILATGPKQKIRRVSQLLVKSGTQTQNTRQHLCTLSPGVEYAYSSCSWTDPASEADDETNPAVL